MNHSNQLPPEFDHLRDSVFPDVTGEAVVAVESNEIASPWVEEKMVHRSVKPDKSLLYIGGAVVAAVVLVLAAKIVINGSSQPVQRQYHELEQIDTAAKSAAQAVSNPEPTVDRPTTEMKPAIQAYEMAAADKKVGIDASVNLDARSNEQLDKRLELVEDAVQKLLSMNETHAQSIEQLRAEQAQLRVKMHSNDESLAEMAKRIDSRQAKLAAPKQPLRKITVSDNAPVVSSFDEKKAVQKTRAKKLELSAALKPIEIPVSPVPPRPKAQLPEGIRLVSIKSLSGKNAAVLRVGGNFSPMLYEGQSWQGIQILNASVQERTTHILYQGDEFGLVL